MTANNSTIFYGNGINRIAGRSLSWAKLLAEINPSVKIDDISIPYTVIYEMVLQENKESEEDVKNEIAKHFREYGSNNFHEELANLDCDNYITTDYDNSLAKSFESWGGEVRSNFEEKVYNIRRNFEIKFNYRTIKLWPIHGNINNPKSIMLELDHYCGSISKIDQYFKGRYEFVPNRLKLIKMTDKIKANKFDNISWIDLFFNSNVHIIGHSLDYSETDLWWILNRRARIMSSGINIKNKIYYYGSDLDHDKMRLLEKMKVILDYPA